MLTLPPQSFSSSLKGRMNASSALVPKLRLLPLSSSSAFVTAGGLHICIL